VSPPVRAARLERGLTCRTNRLDQDTDLLHLAGEAGFVWRSSGHELIAKGTAAILPLPTGPGRLAAAASAVAAALRSIRGGDGDADPEPMTRPIAVGALPYDDASPGQLVIPELIVRRAPDGGVWQTRVTGPLTTANVHGNGAATNGSGRLAGFAGEQPGWPQLIRMVPLQDQESWRRMIVAALREIHAGRLGKVVLARELVVEADRPFVRPAVLHRLARAAGCFLYAQDNFVGASPELLVRRVGPVAVSVPLAGTMARAATPEEEAERVRVLEESAKDAAEHQFVVDAIVEGLGRVGEVTSSPREVLKFNTVAHLATRIEARLSGEPPSALDLVALLHPTPAVGGTPTAAAMALQSRLEGFDRGRYAGPVGWVDAAGDGEWAVALRGAELDGARARLRAGVGVVAGSDPDAEWAEAEAKFGAMLDALWPIGSNGPMRQD
jgi:menaquinone-specific isochorismate synthase